MSLPASCDNLILNNPLIHRYYYSSFRRTYLWVYLTIYSAVVLLLLFINFSARELVATSAGTEVFFRGLYHQFVMIEVALLWVWSTLNSRAALRDEVANKTYDFFRLLPLTALQKATGVLAGKNLLCLLFAVVTFGPLTLFGLLGGLSISMQVQMALVLLSVALCMNSVVLLLSSTSAKRRGKTSTAAWVLLSIFMAPFFLGPLFNSTRMVAQPQDAATFNITFYAFEIPILLMVSFIALYLATWSVFGVLRKFTLEGAPLFSRPGAILFLIGYELITLGLILPHLPGGTAPLFFIWLAVSLLAVVLIPVGSINDWASYLEGCSVLLSGSNRSVRGMVLPLLRRSNLTLGLVLFAVWAVFFFFAGLNNKVGLAQLIADAAALATSFLLLLLLLELYVIYEPVHGKVGVLVAFVVLLYLFLPLILGVTLDIGSLHKYSPFAFLAGLADPGNPGRTSAWSSVLVVNLGLSVVPALFVHRRYTQIIELRQTM